MGGSHAQLDVIDWTLAEAAVRAGLRDVIYAGESAGLGRRTGGARAYVTPA